MMELYVSIFFQTSVKQMLWLFLNLRWASRFIFWFVYTDDQIPMFACYIFLGESAAVQKFTYVRLYQNL